MGLLLYDTKVIYKFWWVIFLCKEIMTMYMSHYDYQDQKMIKWTKTLCSYLAIDAKKTKLLAALATSYWQSLQVQCSATTCVQSSATSCLTWQKVTMLSFPDLPFRWKGTEWFTIDVTILHYKHITANMHWIGRPGNALVYENSHKKWRDQKYVCTHLSLYFFLRHYSIM